MKKTRIFSIHQKLKAKIIEFAGWEMPVEYSSIVDEHLAVRTKAGLFDVSHMGEIMVAGEDALNFVQYLTPNNVAKLFPGKAHYSALTTPQGTFIDDLLVYCLAENQYLLVVNAANTEKDYQWIVSHQGSYKVQVENQSDQVTQLALQGPRAQEILQPLVPVDLGEMKSFRFTWTEIEGEKVLVSRTGYTGEDGFEIYTYSANPVPIWETIMVQGKELGLVPVGLGARDTLRLEACLMLYGNDIDETTTVLEAGLSWIVKFKKGDFLGREALLRQKEEGLKRKIVGFELLERGIPRPHYPVYISNEEVGQVTSGTFSPFFKKSIGLTYLPLDYTEVGTIFEIGIRGKRVKAQVVPTPFYKREK